MRSLIALLALSTSALAQGFHAPPGPPPGPPSVLEITTQDKQIWAQVPQAFLVCIGALKTKSSDDQCASVLQFLTAFSERVRNAAAKPADKPAESAPTPEAK